MNSRRPMPNIPFFYELVAPLGLPGLKGANTRKSALSFDDLVGAQQKGFGDRETERLGRSQIDQQLEARRLLHRKIARLGALEDLVDIGGGVANNCSNVR